MPPQSLRDSIPLKGEPYKPSSLRKVAAKLTEGVTPPAVVGGVRRSRTDKPEMRTNQDKKHPTNLLQVGGIKL